MDQSGKPSKPSSKRPPLPRDSRRSLEVFNPSTYSTPPRKLDLRPQSAWQTLMGEHQKSPDPGPESGPARLNPSSSKSGGAEEKTSWMAFKDPPVPQQSSLTPVIRKFTSDPEKSNVIKQASGEVGVAAQRAAEWGLVLKTDTETGKPQGVGVRTSGGDDSSGRPDTSSNNSVRSSVDMPEAGGNKEIGLPRVSDTIKDALSTFQQTFVVSDATKSDYPILYASAGFFKMTGYTSKEVIGRNWYHSFTRDALGPGTDPEDVAKIRETLRTGQSYCGRLLNYRKDGAPFWNLLTISPIKDEEGNTLKFIGMQVEVSKHTEGAKDKMLRPNGLPESLIRYDARQKELATSSVTEIVRAIKKPRSLTESTNRPNFLRKSQGGGGGGDQDIAVAAAAVGAPGRRTSENLPPPRCNSHGGDRRASMQRISEVPEKKPQKPSRHSFNGFVGRKSSQSTRDSFEYEIIKDDNDDSDSDDHDNDGRPETVDDEVRHKEMRKGMDLATTLERIEKNFVITDPRLPDNPIIFASDSFLELTEYSREEILGRNCRFLQGPETDPATVRKIRQAIDNQTEVTVQLINYTKSGKKFWNLFHLQPMRDQKGEVQYFIGVQLDGSVQVEPLHSSILEDTVQESEILVKQTAENVSDAVKELPDANLTPEDLWANHSKVVHPKPHRKNSPSWKAIQKITDSGEDINLEHFKSIKPLGSGDTGSVHLVELCGTGHYFAMKAMDKGVMLNRNKVHRACAEREILDMLDHPFLPALYASFQTKTHICLITDYCPGGELFLLLDRQPTKVLKEDAVRFYAAEVVVALEYLHCQGIIYRDLKPENVLLQRNGHVSLTDFDLSCLTACKPQILLPPANENKRHHNGQQNPIFMSEPMRASNSFVGTEEYIAPEIITGAGHTSAVDWWALGILLYEMLYGYTPFRGKTRQKTFANILHKDIKFPARTPASLQVKQLIYRLLHRDPKSRLGSREGANEVKMHSFFKGVNWALVRCMNPPELDAPILADDAEKEDKVVDPEMQDLQVNIF